MAVNPINSNQGLPGNLNQSPSFTQTQLDSMTPEQLREVLRLQLSAQNLFGVGPDGVWDPAPQAARNQATKIATEIEKLSLEIESLREQLVTNSGDGEDDEGSDDLDIPMSNEDIIDLIAGAKKKLKEAKVSLQELEALGLDYPGSKAIQDSLSNANKAYRKTKNIINLTETLEDDAKIALKLENPTTAEDFATYLTETTTDAEGNTVFKLVNGNLLLNLTGENDLLESKQNADGIFIKISNPGNAGEWVKVPNKVKKILINCRAGHDTVKIKALDLGIPITIFGGAGFDKIHFNANGHTTVNLGDQTPPPPGKDGSSTWEDIGHGLAKTFGW